MSTTVQEVVAKFTGDDSDLQKTAARATAAMAKYAVSGIGVADGAVLLMIKNSMNAIDATGDLAKSVSISTDKFANMALIFTEAGSSAEGMISSLGIMQRNLADAASGGETTAAAFKSLGLNATSLINLSPDQQFEKIAMAISLVENPTQRAGIAMDIFGKSALKMTDIFVNFAEKAKDAEEFQKKFNLSISDIDTAIIGEANDAMGRVGMTVGGLGNTMATQLSPIITEVSNKFLEAAWGAETMNEVVSGGIGITADFIDVLRKAALGFEVLFSGVESSIASMAGKIQEAMNFIKGELRDIGIKTAPDSYEWINWAKEAKAQTRSVIDDIQNFETSRSKITRASKDALARAKSGQNPLSSGGVFDSTKSPVKKTTDELTEQEKAAKKLQDQYDNLGKAASDNFYDILTGAQSMGDGIRGIMNMVLKSIYDATVGKSMTSTFSNIFSSLSGSISSSSGGSDLFSSIGSSLGSIFKFADGGVVNGATTFPIGSNTGVMGEAGAEAIMPLTRKGGKLGVANYGGGGANITQNLNISTGVSQTVRAELARMMPEIRNQSVKAWSDANKRNRIG